MITNTKKFLKKKIFGPRDLIKDKKISRFQKKVYKILKKVPKGKVTTYKALANKAGTKAYRAVGNALNKNPYGYSTISSEAVRKSGSVTKGKIEKNRRLFSVPCHRVIKTNGEVGGFATGTRNKIKLLKKEGIQILKEKINLKKYNFNLN